MLYAVDINTGKQRWQFGAKGYGLSNPTINSETVYVAGLGGLYALDIPTGSVKWTAIINGSLNSDPAADSRAVYVGGNDGKFYAFDALTGVKKWEFKTGGSTISSLCVVDSDDKTHGVFAR